MVEGEGVDGGGGGCGWWRGGCVDGGGGGESTFTSDQLTCQMLYCTGPSG